MTKPIADVQPRDQPASPLVQATPPIEPVTPPAAPLRLTVVFEPEPTPARPILEVEVEVEVEPHPERPAVAVESPRRAAATKESPRPTTPTTPGVAARETFHRQTVATDSLSDAPLTPGLASNRPLRFATIGLVVVVAAGVFWWMRSGSDATQTAGDQTAPPPPGMVYVPGGELMMGADAGQLQERPAHKVVVKPFFIDRNEVTCEEYSIFIAATGHRAPPNWIGGRHPDGFAQRPVTEVNWDDANAYAAWDGKRLPTEQEWEFAARGTEGRRFPWGNEWKANLANDISSGLRRMTSVGSYPHGASINGANDMIGNAWEWTASDFVPYPGGQLPQTKLPGPLKVIRGGCFVSGQKHATTTYRAGWPARNHQYADTGFRCAKATLIPQG